MKINFILFLFVCVSNFGLLAQDSLAMDAQQFPESWIGDWAGQLDIFTSKGISQSLPMQLKIQPISDSNNFTFVIVYGEDEEKGTRDYVLEVVDAEQGLYRIDEQNSIAIEVYLLGDKLVQRFEVMGNLLETFIEKRGEQLIWEIFSGKLEAASISGDTIINEEEIPEVKSYPMKVYQKAILSKVD